VSQSVWRKGGGVRSEGLLAVPAGLCRCPPRMRQPGRRRAPHRATRDREISSSWNGTRGYYKGSPRRPHWPRLAIFRFGGGFQAPTPRPVTRATCIQIHAPAHTYPFIYISICARISLSLSLSLSLFTRTHFVELRIGGRWTK
jgi:hypothetical protein